MGLPKSIIELSNRFSALPGVGPKLSNRIALYLAISNKTLSERLQSSLQTISKNIRECDQCFNVTDNTSLCEVCSNSERDQKRILVVESPLDLYAIEETGAYDGLYHVLHGVISPVNGVGPDDITIEDLLKRLKSEGTEEVIFGLNPNMEGDSTIMYIIADMESHGLSIPTTRLAKGIPSGSSIEYMSSQTLIDSLKRRY